MKYFYILSILLVCSIISCTYDKGDVPQPVQAVSYQNDIKPIMQTYCYGQGGQACHITPTNQAAVGDFTTYAGLKAKVDNGTIASRVFNLKDMPPAYSLGATVMSADTLEIFKAWVNNGALDN